MAGASLRRRVQALELLPVTGRTLALELQPFEPWPDPHNPDAYAGALATYRREVACLQAAGFKVLGDADFLG